MAAYGFIQLQPFFGDADEDGGFDHAHVGDHGVHRRAFHEGIGGSPKNTAHHFQPAAKGVLDWMMTYTGCVMSTEAGQNILERLQGQHFHIWQEKEAYFILVVSEDTAVYQALRELAQLEANCQTHIGTQPELIFDDEGYLLRVEGPHAFIFARLFLALEQTEKAGDD